MIELELIPEGSDNLPVEVQDHGILADKVRQGHDNDKAPTPPWRSVRRVVTNDRLYLRVDGELDDYGGALDGYTEAITSISGLKKHPDGWVEVGQ